MDKFYNNNCPLKMATKNKLSSRNNKKTNYFNIKSSIDTGVSNNLIIHRKRQLSYHKMFISPTRNAYSMYIKHSKNLAFRFTNKSNPNSFLPNHVHDYPIIIVQRKGFWNNTVAPTKTLAGRHWPLHESIDLQRDSVHCYLFLINISFNPRFVSRTPVVRSTAAQ